jgi:hypothetical protein
MNEHPFIGSMEIYPRKRSECESMLRVARGMFRFKTPLLSFSLHLLVYVCIGYVRILCIVSFVLKYILLVSL